MAIIMKLYEDFILHHSIKSEPGSSIVGKERATKPGWLGSTPCQSHRGLQKRCLRHIQFVLGVNVRVQRNSSHAVLPLNHYHYATKNFLC